MTDATGVAPPAGGVLVIGSISADVTSFSQPAPTADWWAASGPTCSSSSCSVAASPRCGRHRGPGGRRHPRALRARLGPPHPARDTRRHHLPRGPHRARGRADHPSGAWTRDARARDP